MRIVPNGRLGRLLQRAPKSPPRAPKRSPREPQNVCKTIIGSKTLIFQKCKDSHRETNIFEGRRVSLGALKRPSGAPKTSQIRPQNPPKAIFGSKKRANQTQESPKTNLGAFFGRSGGPKELPRAPQEPPRASKRSRREPQYVCKTIIGSKTLIFQTCKDSYSKTIIFKGLRVSLEAQNRYQKVSNVETY